MMRWSNLLQPETMHRLLDRVTVLARSLKVTRGRKLRIDSTVVATAIQYPTDSRLLADGARVLNRLLQHAATALSGVTRRLGVRRTRLAKQLVRRIEATAAVAASASTRAERPTLYRRLLVVAQASVRQAHQVQRWLAGWSEPTAQALESALRSTAPLVQQVIAQTERWVLHG
jgi:IS5 family transposase